MVEGNEVVNGLGHEGMALLGEHEIIGDADGNGTGKDDGVGEEGIERADATNVEVNVNTTVMIEYEVPDGVGPLDGVGVAVKCVEEPRVLICYELAGTRVCPQFVLAGYAKTPGLAHDIRWFDRHVLVGIHIPAPLRHIHPLRRECF